MRHLATEIFYQSLFYERNIHNKNEKINPRYDQTVSLLKPVILLHMETNPSPN